MSMQISLGRLATAAMRIITASSGPAVLANPSSADVSPALTQSDADAWLDGFMPYTLESNDIAGAAVVIVKDGQVLTQRGFGYADVAARKRVDAATTMFRADRFQNCSPGLPSCSWWNNIRSIWTPT